MSWGHDYHDVLEKALPSGALKLLAERLSGSSYSTAFSGVDCPGSVAWFMVCILFVQTYFPSHDLLSLGFHRSSIFPETTFQCLESATLS